MQNVMLLFLSQLMPPAVVQGKVEIRDREADYRLTEALTVRCVQTNEAPVLQVVAQLQEQGESLERIYVLASSAVYPWEETDAAAARVRILCDNELQEWPSLYAWFEACVKSKAAALGLSALAETRLEPVRYDEQKSDIVQESRNAVSRLLKQLQEDYGERLESCNLYADITGGFRHTAMLLSSALRLLQYRGLVLKSVVYSNFVQGGNGPHRLYDFMDIDRLFTLVAGADAFAHTGNAQALTAYFEEEEDKSAELEELLARMQSFSEVVGLCQVARIMPVLAELEQALKNFEGLPQRRPAEELFAQLLKPIHDSYDQMFSQVSEEEQKLGVIEWCVGNALLQQALTFCTEWLPDVLVNKRIFFWGSEEVRQNCTAQTEANKSFYGTSAQFFLVQYNQKKNSSPAVSPSAKALQKGIVQNIRAIARGLKDSYSEAKVEKLLGQYAVPSVAEAFFRELPGELARVKKLSNFFPEEADRQPVVVFLRKLYEQKKNTGTFKKTMAEFIRNVKEKNVAELVNWSEETLVEFFALNAAEPENGQAAAGLPPATEVQTAEPVQTDDDDITYEPEPWLDLDKEVGREIVRKVKERLKICIMMLSDGRAGTNVTPEEALALVTDYIFLRQCRHQINHANSEFIVSQSDLQEKIWQVVLQIHSLAGRG